MRDNIIKFLVALFIVVIANVTYWVLTHVLHWDKVDTAFGIIMGFMISLSLDIKDLMYRK